MKFFQNETNKRILSIVFFLICFLLSLVATDVAFSDKNTLFKYSDFHNEKNDFDVLFFGSSHMEMTVSPLELWKEYGIVSYNFGNPEEGFPITYWVIANAISEKKPKVVVVDMHMFGYGDVYVEEERLHYGLDSFRINEKKIQAVNDLLHNKNTRLEMFFKLGNYHSRWKELGESDFRDTSMFFKGFFSYGHVRTTSIKQLEQYELETEVWSEMSYDCMDVEYMDKLIELCKKEDVELVFTVNPYVCSSSKQQILNFAQMIADDRNVPFINMLKMPEMVDYETDFYDEGHLNVMGMHKVTRFFGEYLMSNYELEDHRSDNRYESWNQSFVDYMNLKYESIMWQDDIDKTLLLLDDMEIESYVYCKDGIDLDDLNVKLLSKLTKIDNPNSFYSDDRINDKDVIIIVKDKETKELKLVKTFVISDENIVCENLYNNFPFKYMFGR